jgi:hypothetical protein
VQVPPAKHPSQADSKHHSAHGNSQSGLAQFPDNPLGLLAWVFQYPNTPQNVLLPSNHLLEIMLHIGRLARVSFLGLLQLFQMLGQSGHMLGMVKTRKESTPIKVWVTPEEKAAIAAKADAHSLSASSYLRRLGLAMPLQSTIDQRAILDLVKINADLGRFGGLIKMWLTTNADFESISAQGLQRKLENTLSDVRQLQKKMSDRLEDL